MSKKTRKKSRKSPAPGKARKPASKASARRTDSKTGGSTAKKSGSHSKSGQTSGRTLSSKASSSKAPSSKTSSSKASSSKAKRSPAATRTQPAEGERAPAFHLPRDGGNTVSLQDFAGRKLVLFFYPRADTPGCTREAIDFTRLKDAFAATGASVVGVSGDAPKAQEAFRNKHKLAVPLASDEQHEMLAAYGAWGEKSMYGRTFEGIIRTTVLIGADGKIVRIWRNVRVDGHADDVLEATRAA